MNKLELSEKGRNKKAVLATADSGLAVKGDFHSGASSTESAVVTLEAASDTSECLGSGA